jgi:hypothetical protein
MPLISRKRVLGIDIETTAGTAETLDGTDAVFNAYNIDIALDQELQEREAEGGEYAASATAGQSATMTFTTDLRYNGTDVPIWATRLLPCCGWVNSSGTFTPRLDGPGSAVKTATLTLWVDGKQETIYGAMGNFEIVFPSRRTAFINWTFQGIYAGESDAAMPTPTGTSIAALKASSMTATWNSVAMCFEQLTINSGNDIQLIECATTAAWAYALAGNRQPTIVGNPETVLSATQDRVDQWALGTEAALSIAIGNAITFSAPKSQITSIARGDRTNVSIDDITWACNKNGTTANQSLSIAFS